MLLFFKKIPPYAYLAGIAAAATATYLFYTPSTSKSKLKHAKLNVLNDFLIQIYTFKGYIYNLIKDILVV